MGYALGWVAVQGGRADAIHEKLGVLSTGNREDAPEAAVVGAILPNGGTLWLCSAVSTCSATSSWATCPRALTRSPASSKST